MRNVQVILFLLLFCIATCVHQVMICYFVGMIVSLIMFRSVPASSPLLQWLALFCFGHFLYGPQMLMALTGAETVPKSAVATSNGFLG